MFCLYILRFFPPTARRTPCIIHFFSSYECYKKQESSITLLVLLSHEQVFLLGFEYPSQAISDSESFLLCEHFPYIIRESVADSRFSFTYVTLGTQGFRPYPNNFFLAITDILSEYIHAHRFQSRCSKLFYIYGIFILSFQH